MTLFFVLRGWFESFLRWLTEPSPEEVRRSERDEKARRLREAQKAVSRRG